MAMEDLANVCQLEKLAYSIPWSDKVHRECIEAQYPSILIEDSREFMGYAVFNYLLDECHLLNIAIHPKFQGQGFATSLLHAMLVRAENAGMVKVILEVRASNQSAIGFYQKEQFSQIGIRKKYYKTARGHEDAIVMEKILEPNIYHD